jgi:hypothetical protein
MADVDCGEQKLTHWSVSSIGELPPLGAAGSVTALPVRDTNWAIRVPGRAQQCQVAASTDVPLCVSKLIGETTEYAGNIGLRCRLRSRVSV